MRALSPHAPILLLALLFAAAYVDLRVQLGGLRAELASGAGSPVRDVGRSEVSNDPARDQGLPVEHRQRRESVVQLGPRVPEVPVELPSDPQSVARATLPVLGSPPPGRGPPVEACDGTVDAAQLQPALVRFGPDVFACHNEVAPGVRGTLELELTLDANGVVRRTGFAGPARAHEALVRCVAERAARWQLPKPTTNCARIVLPFALGGGPGAPVPAGPPVRRAGPN